MARAELLRIVLPVVVISAGAGLVVYGLTKGSRGGTGACTCIGANGVEGPCPDGYTRDPTTGKCVLSSNPIPTTVTDTWDQTIPAANTASRQFTRGRVLAILGQIECAVPSSYQPLCLSDDGGIFVSLRDSMTGTVYPNVSFVNFGSKDGSPRTRDVALAPYVIADEVDLTTKPGWFGAGLPFACVKYDFLLTRVSLQTKIQVS